MKIELLHIKRSEERLACTKCGCQHGSQESGLVGGREGLEEMVLPSGVMGWDREDRKSPSPHALPTLEVTCSLGLVRGFLRQLCERVFV